MADLKNTKGYHLYPPTKLTADTKPATNVGNDLFGPRSDYVLEVWIAGRLSRAIVLPIHPEAIEILRPQHNTMNYTFGLLPNREHTRHRNLDIRITGRSGIGDRYAHDREGNAQVGKAPFFIRELDAFLDYYQAQCVQNADYFQDPANYRRNYNAVTLVFRSFSEHIHVRVEPISWRMKRSSKVTRFGYEFDLRLQAYAPAVAKKSTSLFSSIDDVIAIATDALLQASNLAAQGNSLIQGVNGAANTIRGPLQSAQTIANQLDQLTASVVSVANVPRLVLRDLAQIVRKAANAYVRLNESKGGGFGALGAGLTDELRNIGISIGVLERSATAAITATGVLGARGRADISPSATASLTPETNPSSPTGSTSDQYSQPGSQVEANADQSEDPYLPVIVVEGDTLPSLAQRWLGDTRYWRVIADANNMPSAYYTERGTPLKSGDSIRIPRVSTLLDNATLSPTQDIETDRFGRDLLLNPITGDLEIVNATDIRTVFDSKNLEQAIRNRLLTRQGESSYFPSYGLPNVVGTKVTSETLGYVSAQLNEQLLSDPRILELDKLDLVDEGDTITALLEIAPVVGANVSVISPI